MLETLTGQSAAEPHQEEGSETIEKQLDVKVEPSRVRGSPRKPQASKDEDIVHTISNNGIIYDVGSTYPGGEEAPKGMAVRHLKSHASWVQTVVRQVGLLSAAGVDT